MGPLQPGMVVAIEQGAVVEGTRVAFEDDVLVTEDGHEWLTAFIPIEIDDVEALRREDPVVEPGRLLPGRWARRRRGIRERRTRGREAFIRNDSY